MKRPIGAGGLAMILALATGCGGRPEPRAFRGEDGLRFAPPAGWSERAPSDGRPGLAAGERLLVQYKRLTAGRPAWLRLTAADVSPSIPLDACAAARPPGRDWRREGLAEQTLVGGQPAARVRFAGRWGKLPYSGEVVAVRRAGRVYLFTATFPAAEAETREQVRQAVAAATWPGAEALAGR
ncbi:MAG TPA: hypothetical protein VFA26_24395 [Gemmataceae bacterium]|nr:hypothetical protein [Gemmataceae bacterium]